MKNRFLHLILTTSVTMSAMNSSAQAQTKVLLHTTLGDITIKLYDETPKHKANFIKLVKEGYYDGLLFHRVISGFMIQTGDPKSRSARPGEMLGSGGPGYTIPAEILPQYYHKKGAIAAARLGDQVNPKKESSGSQFYIVQGQTFTDEQLNMLISSGKHKPFTPEQLNTYTTIGGAPHLDNEYTVFGEIIEGMDVVDKIAAVQVDMRNRPVQDIKILKATIIE